MVTALVVEDSLTDRAIISGCLREQGLDVHQAGSEDEALNLIDGRNYDIIFLDVILPGRSGFELCRQLKSKDITKDTPVIICSTKGSELDKFWGMKQGADAYLTKPVDGSELLQIVGNLLGSP